MNNAAPTAAGGTDWRAGFGVGSLTVWEPGLCMFGWADARNTVEGVRLALRARAMVIEERATGSRVAHVTCDLGMISESLRFAVGQRLCVPGNGLQEHDLMLTATHTHSGPSGYSTYFFYAMSAPGVSRPIHDALVDGICSAVEAAIASLRPARLYAHAAPLAVSEPVAFNRSMAAYNQNLDVEPLPWERRDEAVDRTMTVLRVDDEHGAGMGVLSWFPVHGTSIHADNHLLHADNKGYAAEAFEAWARAQGSASFVASFAQAAAGDVSPNHRWHKGRRRMIGSDDDDDASARANGEAQALHARSVYLRARDDGSELHGPLDAALCYRDFYDQAADERFLPRPPAGGRADGEARTGRPLLGAGAGAGTLEGPGPLYPVRALLPSLHWIRRVTLSLFRPSLLRGPRGPVLPFIDLAEGRSNRIFGAFHISDAAFALLGDPRSPHYRDAILWQGTRDVGWVPRHLPFQLMRIGSLIIAGLPNEPTTTAGRRISAVVGDAWVGRGIERVVVNGYANGYCSYLATPEEFQVQAYEGASTLYGQWSLPVFQTLFARLAEEMHAGRARDSLGDLPSYPPLSWSKPTEGSRGLVGVMRGD